jgi:hypothetical protein
MSTFKEIECSGVCLEFDLQLESVEIDVVGWLKQILFERTARPDTNHTSPEKVSEGVK